MKIEIRKPVYFVPSACSKAELLFQEMIIWKAIQESMIFIMKSLLACLKCTALHTALSRR